MLFFAIACTFGILGFVAGALVSPYLGIWESSGTGDSDTPIADALAREMGFEL
jgi:hypothetical protein